MNQQSPFLYSILSVKCPRCREGNMFPKGTLYTTRFSDMYKNCPCCGQTFEPEPGYYYGAMYLSFGFNVVIFLAAFFILFQLVEVVTLAMMMAVVGVLVIGFLPVIFRLSRVLWINIFVRYEGPCSQIPKRANS